jgi:hypothetical protein
VQDVLDALSALSDAFEARDLNAAMACFGDAPDVMFAASAGDDYAIGPNAISDTLRDVFARDESYSWTVDSAEYADGGAFRIVLAELTGYERRDGAVEAWPLQLSGVLTWDDGWRWRNLTGVLPSARGASEHFRDERRSRSIPAPATSQLQA